MKSGIDRIPVPHIPGFALDCRCGQGGSSEVWLGKDRSGRRRAVRLVSRKRDPALLAREREALSLYRAAGDHANLLKILDSGETADYLYSVTEAADNFLPVGGYVPDTLARRIGLRTGNLRTVLNDLDSITAGVEQLHRRDLVHGDLHPGNILFVRGVLKVADPGLVARSDSVPCGGTSGFRPPWEAAGVECDIYAVGKLIYLLCTHEDPDRFPDLPRSCDLEEILPLNEIALRCCEREGGTRFRHISELRRELECARKYMDRRETVIFSAWNRSACSVRTAARSGRPAAAG